MDKNSVIEKVKELVKAPSIYGPLKEIAENYLAAVGATDEKAKAKALIDALEECVETIDSVISFFSTEEAVKLMGKENATNILNHAKEVKANGGKFCDCPACAPGKIILDNRAAIL